jgi:hypothetical protein
MLELGMKVIGSLICKVEHCQYRSQDILKKRKLSLLSSELIFAPGKTEYFPIPQTEIIRATVH